MKRISLKTLIWVAVVLLASSPAWNTHPTHAQVPPIGVPPPPGMLVPVSPQSQRSAMNSVRSRVQWLQNALRTAPGYNTGGDQVVGQALQELRLEYRIFTQTLTSQQANYGANDLAELAAGIDILEEGIGNFQQDVASGRNARRAVGDMCQVMQQGADFWLQEFNRVCANLRVGRP